MTIKDQQSESVVQQDKNKSSVPGWVWAAIAAAITALGIGTGAYFLNNEEPDVRPDDRSHSESLLQWLEDEGEHIP